MKQILKKLYLFFCGCRLFPPKKSYSQCGEDIITSMVARQIGLKSWTWLDIGAHHPTSLNNTAMFYAKGMHGLNIEADPELIKSFRLRRRKDINLNIAIADKRGVMDFYVMDQPTLNTLSKAEANRYQTLGHKITKVIKIETMTIDDIIVKYCNGGVP